MKLAVLVVLVAVVVVLGSSLLGHYMAGSERAQGVPEYRSGFSIAATSSWKPAL